MEKPPLPLSCAKRYFVTRTSTRRFFARPASVVFGAAGFVSANPAVVEEARPPSARAFAALAARASESSLFVGNFFFNELRIGRLSVWPSTATLYSGKSFKIPPTCLSASAPAGLS